MATNGFVFSAAAIGVVAVGIGALSTPTAAADPPPRPPNCTAADLAGIASGVAASTSAYLFTHPDVNEFYTGLAGRTPEEKVDATRTYFDGNPQAHADLLGIRQPLIDFHRRCGLGEPNMPLGQ